MKFGSKLMYLDYLHQLAQHISLSQLIIPPAIRKSVHVVLSQLHKEFLAAFFDINQAVVG